MKGNRFYSIPYDARNDPNMKWLRRKFGGIVAYGRWQALLGILYDQGGTVDLSDEVMRGIVSEELELKGSGLDEWIKGLVAVGWLDQTAWESFGKIHSKSVCEQLAFQEGQSNRRRGKTKESAIIDEFVEELVEGNLLDRRAWEDYASTRGKKRK